VCALLGAAQPAFAQRDTAVFLGGAAVALAAHETGHLIFDAAFGASPGLAKVSFGGIPFFAITHDPVSPTKEFTISSAGFWVQHGTDELLLSRDPHVRDRRSPFIDGVLAFNVLTSIGYAATAFAQAGPLERDTRGMAVSAGVAEPVVGAFLLAPAVLDAWRYYRPEDRWAKWGSRAAKVAGVLLVFRTK